MLVRSIPPPLYSVQPKPFPPFERVELKNGLTIYFIPFGSQPIVEVQRVVPAGLVNEPHPAVAGLTARMLTEGTLKLTATQLAQALDGYGASLTANAGYEMATLNLSSLTKYLPQTFELFKQVALEALIPEPEFELHRRRTLSSLEVEQRKTGWQAKRLFAQTLYGAEHPYGKTALPEHFRALQVDFLRDFYRKKWLSTEGFIIVSGQFNRREILAQLEDAFGGMKTISTPTVSVLMPEHPKPVRLYHEMSDNPQSTVLLGYRLFGRKHPDYHPLRLVILILGGYFGSRLMRNIREDKGYTYGINSTLNLMKQDGHLAIATDVANAYVGNTIQEVQNEMKLLIEVPVEEDELLTARNYLLGRILGSRETPFQLADQLKHLLIHELPVEDIAHGIQILQEMTPNDIQAIAKKYLHPDQLLEVVAGGKA